MRFLETVKRGQQVSVPMENFARQSQILIRTKSSEWDVVKVLRPIIERSTLTMKVLADLESQYTWVKYFLASSKHHSFQLCYHRRHRRPSTFFRWFFQFRYFSWTLRKLTLWRHFECWCWSLFFEWLSERRCCCEANRLGCTQSQADLQEFVRVPVWINFN